MRRSTFWATINMRQLQMAALYSVITVFYLTNTTVTCNIHLYKYWFYIKQRFSFANVAATKHESRQTLKKTAASNVPATAY